MNSLARAEANQRNSQRSTGPRTAEGKLIVSRNATRHGIFAAVPVIPGEDPAAWDVHRAGGSSPWPRSGCSKSTWPSGRRRCCGGSSGSPGTRPRR